MKLGIYGYGNLGRGVEAAVRQNEDAELVGIFTRRSPDRVKSESGAPVFSANDVFPLKKRSTSSSSAAGARPTCRSSPPCSPSTSI